MMKSSRKRRIVAFLIDHFVITFLIVTILFLFFGEELINGDNPMKPSGKFEGEQYKIIQSR